jgi:hypothetical protein
VYPDAADDWRLRLCYLTGVKCVVAWLLLAALTAAPAWARGWKSYKLIRGQSPIEVYSNSDDRRAVEALTTLEQVRWMVARLLGKDEVRPVWPVRVVMIAPGRDSARYLNAHLRLSRDLYVAGVDGKQGLPPQLLREYVRLLLESETRRLPPEIEDGLAEVFSTASAEATRISVGAPPEKERQTRDWARMHLLAVTPEYAGRVRVFFSVLQAGAGYEIAYKNAFESTQKEMEAKVDRYFQAGQFEPQTVSGMPLNPNRDIRKRDLEDAAAELALADLLDGEDRRKAFLALVNSTGSPEAMEGAELYEEAVKAGTQSAMAWHRLGLSLRESDSARAIELLARAAELNARWAEPHARIAELETQLERKIPRWRKAVELDPRNARYWEELADAQQQGRLYEEAAQSWRTAELAAATEEERERIRQRRLAYEKRRLDLEAAELKRQEEEKARELEQLRQEALARIRAAEAKAREGKEAIDPTKVVEWWDGPRPEGKASGALERVECVRGKLRLVVREPDGKLVKYLVPDPNKVVLMGGGQIELRCGPQKPPPAVSLEFTPRKDAAEGTVGDVAVVEFR